MHRWSLGSGWLPGIFMHEVMEEAAVESRMIVELAFRTFRVQWNSYDTQVFSVVFTIVRVCL